MERGFRMIQCGIWDKFATFRGWNWIHMCAFLGPNILLLCVYIRTHIWIIWKRTCIQFMLVFYVCIGFYIFFVFVFVIIGSICVLLVSSNQLDICLYSQVIVSNKKYLLAKKQTASSEWLADQPWKMASVSSY